MYDRILLSNKIYYARLQSGLKQKDMSNNLHISQSMYSKIESGNIDMKLPMLFDIAEVLNISPYWLLINDNLSISESYLKFKLKNKS